MAQLGPWKGTKVNHWEKIQQWIEIKQREEVNGFEYPRTARLVQVWWFSWLCLFQYRLPECFPFFSYAEINRLILLTSYRFQDSKMYSVHQYKSMVNCSCKSKDLITTLHLLPRRNQSKSFEVELQWNPLNSTRAFILQTIVVWTNHHSYTIPRYVWNEELALRPDRRCHRTALQCVRKLILERFLLFISFVVKHSRHLDESYSKPFDVPGESWSSVCGCGMLFFLSFKIPIWFWVNWNDYYGKPVYQQQ